MFKCEKFNDKIFYTILVLGNSECIYNYDHDIAEKIGITLEEYQQTLSDLGAFLDEEEDEMYFLTKQQANKTANYLNEKYGVILKLTE